MRWKIVTAICVLFALNPTITFASSCLDWGYTIVFINGILNEEEKARKSADALQRLLGESFRSEPLVVRLGHNQSHLAGAADLIQSIAQTYDNPVSDFDRDTILRQIHPQVNTRKILLVGHSQGTFYANAIHRYFLEHGMKESSIAVYNLATPASFVAGGGTYKTSTNDKVINKIRDYNRTFNTARALPGNIHIPLPPGEENDDWGGHHFSSSYLDAVPQVIIGDIAQALDRLQAIPGTAEDGCFDPPGKTLKQKVEEVALKVGDPLALAIKGGTESVLDGTKVAIQNAKNNISSATHAAAKALSNFWSRLTPKFSAASSQVASVGSLASPPTEPVSEKSLPANTASQTANHSPTVATPASSANVSRAEQILALQQQVQELQQMLEKQLQQTASQPSKHTPSVPESQASNRSYTYSSAGGTGSNATPDSESDSATSTPPVEEEEVEGPDEPAEEETETEDIPLSLAITSPEDGAFSATTSVAFTGTTTASVLVTAQHGTTTATTIADIAGDWSFSLELPEGETQVALVAADGEGDTSDVITRTVTVDLTAPATPTPLVGACDHSLSTMFCLVPTASITLAWSDANDAASYAVVKNGTATSTTTATSSIETLSSNATTTFSVVAYDTAGNAATSTPIEAYSYMQPVVINEIGWAGREAASELKPEDQWIELKNVSPFVLDMTHASIVRTTGEYIQLAGPLNASVDNDLLTVLPHDFAILGSGTKLIVPFDLLSTSGEQLSIVWSGDEATTTVDITPATETCSGWCVGAVNAALGVNAEGTSDLHSPLSMERKSSPAEGPLTDSWQDTDSYGPSMGNNTFLWGTPGAENSNGYPDAGVVCGNEILLSADSGPGPSYSVGGECLFLTKFISGGSSGRNRSVNLFRGDVGSSTRIKTHSLSKSLAAYKTTTMPADSVSGEQFFIAIWEIRSGPAFSDTPQFNAYFETGANPAPHTNYKILPFTYSE